MKNRVDDCRGFLWIDQSDFDHYREKNFNFSLPLNFFKWLSKVTENKFKSEKMALPETNPVYGPFFGVMGASSAIIFSGKCLEKIPLTERKKNGWKQEKVRNLCKFLIFLLSKTFLMISIMFFILISSRSCLWNSKIWNGNCGNECHETWIDYEINHSSCYGWYYCYLWLGRCCSHRWWFRWTQKLHPLQVSSILIIIFFISFKSKASHVTTYRREKKSMI